MKYVLMFVDTEDYAKEVEAMSRPELEQVYRRVNQWFVDHADKITGNSGKLQGAARR